MNTQEQIVIRYKNPGNTAKGALERIFQNQYYNFADHKKVFENYKWFATDDPNRMMYAPESIGKALTGKDPIKPDIEVMLARHGRNILASLKVGEVDSLFHARYEMMCIWNAEAIPDEETFISRANIVFAD